MTTRAETIYFTQQAQMALKQMRLQKKKEWVNGAELLLD
jgi:hypothetical protein